jgi:hypothetical protein
MIPDTTREAVLEAMELFDRELRDSPEWTNWEQKNSHKYAIKNMAITIRLRKSCLSRPIHLGAALAAETKRTRTRGSSASPS